MRPSHYHYLKRMWIRNTFKAKGKKIRKKAVKYKKSKHVSYGSSYSNYNFNLLGAFKTKWPTIFVFLIWTIFVFLNIGEIYIQIGLFRGIVCYLFGVVLFCSIPYIVYKSNTRNHNSNELLQDFYDIDIGPYSYVRDNNMQQQNRKVNLQNNETRNEVPHSYLPKKTNQITEEDKKIIYIKSKINRAKVLSEIINKTTDEKEFYLSLNEITRILYELSKLENEVGFTIAPSTDLKRIVKNRNITIENFEERVRRKNFDVEAFARECNLYVEEKERALSSENENCEIEDVLDEIKAEN